MKQMLSNFLNADWRNIANGIPIVKDGYADQPYLIKTDDGAWLCCVTVSSGEEGNPDQHVQTMRSTDMGASWSAPVRLEAPGEAENSYAVMLKTTGRRIYIFYNHNTDRVKEVLFHDRSGSFDRVDSLGHYVFRYSDDDGRSWSEKRYEIPVREFACDRNNVYGGKIRFFWNVGRPCLRNNEAFLTLHKVGEMGEGFYSQSEGALLHCPNINSESDPEKLIWETLPDGDTGLLSPPGCGKIAEEQNCVVLSDGTICCSYRSVCGYGIEAYSRDGGHTFSEPHFKLRYDGTPLKNPRACNTVWKYAPGKYLYWFHNHGGKFILDMVCGKLRNNFPSPYSDRNPVWLCGGTEVATDNGLEIRWGEPQIVLYDRDRDTRMSYPDFIMENGRCFLTETEKKVARIHEIPTDFLESLFTPVELKSVAVSEGGEIDFSVIAHPDNVFMPGANYTLRFELDSFTPGTLCRSVNDNGLGFEVKINENNKVLFLWLDPQQGVFAASETLPGRTRDLKITLDMCAAVLSFTADGRFCDGGDEKQFGWQRLSRDMSNLFAGGNGKLGSMVKRMTVYEK